MPQIDQNELIVHVEWNENIHVDENRHRVNVLFGQLLDEVLWNRRPAIGQQDYLLNREQALSSSEAEFYFKTFLADGIAPLQKQAGEW